MRNFDSLAPVGGGAVKRFDPIESVIRFNLDAGNTGTVVNVRQSALYTGLQVEELAEKLAAVGLHMIAKDLNVLAIDLRNGDFDHTVERAMQDPANRLAMLDADCDLFVVSVGAAISQGADFVGAIREVCDSNDSKRNDAGALVRDDSGKIVKGANYREPDLRPFIKA